MSSAALKKIVLALQEESKAQLSIEVENHALFALHGREIQTLKDALASLTESVGERLMALEEGVQTVDAGLQSCCATCSEYRREQHVREEIDQAFRRDLDLLKVSSERSNAWINQLQRSIEDIGREQRSGSTDQAAKLRASLQRVDSLAVALRSESRSRLEAVEEISGRLEKHSAQLASLKHRKTEEDSVLDQTLGALEQAISQLQAEHRQDIAQVQMDAASLDSRLEETEKRLSGCKLSSNELGRTVQALQRELRSRLESLSRACASLGEAQQRKPAMEEMY